MIGSMMAFTALVVTTTTADLDRLILEVRAASFPELSSLSMTTVRFSSPTVFFMSSFDVVIALDDDEPLQLLVSINDAVLRDPPSDLAIRAVLAHELGHSIDVRRRQRAGARGLFELLLALLWPPAEAQMERATDLIAVGRG